MNKIQSMPRYFNADKISQQYLARDAQTISMVADGLEVLKINASFSPHEFAALCSSYRKI